MPTPFEQITFQFNAPPESVKENIRKIESGKKKTDVAIMIKTSANTSKEKKEGSKRGRRSLKDTDAVSETINVPEDEQLFKKQYYAIGEVAGMFHENQSLIRYWETEFDILQPRKNRKGDRFFRPVDIKNLVLIHDLLRRRKFTIEGAKTYLKKSSSGPAAETKFDMIQSLRKIKGFLLELKANL
jgi:DNA-binding transcriptional MerR regulator